LWPFVLKVLFINCLSDFVYASCSHNQPTLLTLVQKFTIFFIFLASLLKYFSKLLSGCTWEFENDWSTPDSVNKLWWWVLYHLLL
jgi:hypothetical protein